ncbi:hypothetical protein [Sinomicrobium sp. M5D2P9]
MKKLNLSKWPLQTDEVLQRNELKMILGGNNGGYGGYGEDGAGCNADDGCDSGCSEYSAQHQAYICTHCCIA